MEQIIKFVQVYWREILEVVALLLTFLLFLLKKVKVENPSILAFIDTVLPVSITAIEEALGSGNGSEKKKQVMDTVLQALKMQFYGINEKKYKKIISDKIEVILSTPQKKG